MNHRTRAIGLGLGLALLTMLVASGSPAGAQDKAYVFIAAIPGQSTDPAHLNWMDAYAVDTKVTKPTTGAPIFADVAFLKGTDSATPHLHDAVASSVMYPTLLVDVCRPGPSAQECYYRVELTNARITSVELSGSSCVGPSACTPAQTESVTVTYTRIKWTYTPFTGGTPGTPIVRCFDLATNSRC